MTTRPGGDFATGAVEAVFRGRRVFVTGHTGFKGSWLTLWLSRLGSEVTGFSLDRVSTPSAFDALAIGDLCRRDIRGDVRDLVGLRRALTDQAPEIVFHLAAQPLVRRSYEDPLATYETNVIGTANLLEAIRREGLRCVVVVVTTDKCYENRDRVQGYREDDPLGGRDPYSSSKAAAELVTASYRNSFFPAERLTEHGVAVATARAGNVIGGGDWAQDRIVPDAIRALAAKEAIVVRNPGAIRPWQHVIEPLAGYLMLAARMFSGARQERLRFCEAWNFGPLPTAASPVSDIVTQMIASWGEGRWVDGSDPKAPHEASVLRLCVDKAAGALGWRPVFATREMLDLTVGWYRAFYAGAAPAALRSLAAAQIDDYGVRLERTHAGT